MHRLNYRATSRRCAPCHIHVTLKWAVKSYQQISTTTIVVDYTMTPRIPLPAHRRRHRLPWLVDGHILGDKASELETEKNPFYLPHLHLAPLLG